MPSNFSVALYYAARSYVEIPAPAKISAGRVEVAIPFSVIPRKLAAAAPGDRLRMQFRGKDVRPSPILNVRIANKQKALGRHVLELEVLDWDKLARYWRIQIETPDPPD